MQHLVGVIIGVISNLVKHATISNQVTQVNESKKKSKHKIRKSSYHI
uniref:Uncharacterized protein n=1 Tax=Rhizophora mucronata TaxID=61149 RepID=A0A2P2QZT1_RHIMU